MSKRAHVDEGGGIETAELPYLLLLSNDEDASYYCMYALADTQCARRVLKMFEDIRASTADNKVYSEAALYSTLHSRIKSGGLESPDDQLGLCIGNFAVSDIIPAAQLGEWTVCEYKDVPIAISFNVYMVWSGC